MGEVLSIAPRYVSTTRYEVRVEPLLPLNLKPSHEGIADVTVFEPSAEAVMERLVYLLFRAKVHELLLELKTTEYGARLLAMSNATENADNLIKELRLTFFKKRQEQITKELMDIVEAAEGLKE